MILMQSNRHFHSPCRSLDYASQIFHTCIFQSAHRSLYYYRRFLLFRCSHNSKRCFQILRIESRDGILADYFFVNNSANVY